MTRAFSMIAGIMLLAVAAAHAYRLYQPFTVIVSGHDIPLWYSWPGAVVAGFVGLMVLVGARR